MELTKRTYDLWMWIAAALIVRLVLMATTAHSDIVFLNFFPEKFAYEGVVDIYRYIDTHFPAGRLWSYYPPLTYFELGCFQWALKPFASGFPEWINQAYSQGLDKWLLANGTSLRVMKYLFLMKVPYLFYDALCLWGAMMMFPNAEHRLRAGVLWMFSPVVLYGTYMFGQADIMPAALVLLSVLVIEKGYAGTGFFFLGMGALFKTFPIFLVPVLLVLVPKSGKELLKCLAAAALPFALVLLPYVLSGSAGAIKSLFPNAYTDYSDRAVDLTWVFLRRGMFGILYASIIGYAWIRSRTAKGKGVLAFALASVLALYALFFAPIHYFLWAVPLLIVAVVRGIIPERLYWLFTGTVFIYGLNSARTTTEIFAPLDPGLFLGLPGLPDMVHNLGIRWGYVMMGAEALFVALCVMTAVALAGESPSFRRILGIRGN